VGGQFGAGRVFELKPSGAGGWKEKVIYDFPLNGQNGPSSSVIFDDAGNLYGATDQGGNLSCGAGFGCGGVFELSPQADGSWKETDLYGFAGSPDGAYPIGDLVFDSAGNLYGATQSGGNVDNRCVSENCGTIFKLTPDPGRATWTETVIHAFDGASGQPSAGLVIDAADRLYGTTFLGGRSRSCQYGCGTVFEMTPAGSGWKEKIVFSFQGGGNGYDPEGGLVLDREGNLYGGLWRGGNGGGAIFELRRRRGHWQELMLYNFCTLNNCADGTRPAGVTLGENGTLYGTTSYGGKFRFDGYYCGVVFKLTHSGAGWKETVLHNFGKSTADGMFPEAGVIVGPEGKLYGTTLGGGGGDECTFGDYGGCGTVFEVTP